MKSIYCDKNWNKLQEYKEEGTAETFEFQCEDGKIRYEFNKRFAGKVEGEDYYDLVTPRGMGGPRMVSCIAGEEKRLAGAYLKKLEEYCREENIIAEYVRFDPWDKRLEGLFGNYYEIEKYGDLYCNNLERDFYKEEYNRKTRREIKKAMSWGVHAEFDFNGESIDEFVKLYQNTAIKYNVSAYYRMDRCFIEKYFEMLPGNVFILNAFFEEKVIASVIVLMGVDIAHYHLLGSDPEYRQLHANSLLTYKAAEYAKTLGKKLFDLGGGKRGGNIETFKLNFVKEENIYTYYVGKKINNEIIYNYLAEQNKNQKEGYFPAYRK